MALHATSRFGHAITVDIIRQLRRGGVKARMYWACTADGLTEFIAEFRDVQIDGACEDLRHP